MGLSRDGTPHSRRRSQYHGDLRVALLVLVGCNQVYGLDSTHLPPLDARATCPEFGGDLSFTTDLVQVIDEQCFQYVQGADRAVAACGSAIYTIKEGAASAKHLAAAAITPMPGTNFDMVTLTPEGDQLFVRQQSIPIMFFRYHRVGTAWGPPDMPFGTLVVNNDSIGAPSALDGPAGRRILVAHTQTLRELAENPDGTYRLLRDMPYSDLGVMFIASPNLSRDGYRFLFSGGNGDLGGYYAERASLDAAFGPAKLIGGLPPGAMTPFMTESCGYLYLSGLGRVFRTSR